METATQTLGNPSNYVEQPQYSNGTLINQSGSPRIYFYLDGKPCHIPDMDTYLNLFDTMERTAEDTLYGFGPALTSGAYLGQNANDNKIYLVSNGIKRWIISPEVFAAYHFNSNKIVVSDDIDGIDRGANIA